MDPALLNFPNLNLGTDNDNGTPLANKEPVTNVNQDGNELPSLRKSYCEVCNARATGHHYGADTCDGCKVFFQRNHDKKGQNRCRGQGQCQLEIQGRSKCRHCRLEKCFAVGMGIKNIHRGRYTYFNGRPAQRAGIQSGSPQLRRTKVEEDLFMEDIIKEFTESEKKARLEEKTKNMQNAGLVHTPNSENEPVMDSVLQEVLSDTTVDPSIVLDVLQSGISMSEKFQRLVKGLETAYMANIIQAKSMHGFASLLVEDQISLLKATAAESIIMRLHHLSRESFNDQNHPSRRLFASDSAFWEGFVTIGLRMQKMQLDDTEKGLLQGICLFQSDRCPLTNKDKVDTIQNLLSEVLTYYIQRYKPTESHRLGHLLTLLHDLRSMFHLNDVFYKQMTSMWPKDLIPQLLQELNSNSLTKDTA